MKRIFKARAVLAAIGFGLASLLPAEAGSTAAGARRPEFMIQRPLFRFGGGSEPRPASASPDPRTEALFEKGKKWGTGEWAVVGGAVAVVVVIIIAASNHHSGGGSSGGSGGY